MSDNDTCPDCCQGWEWCVCYIAVCPSCGAEGRVLGALDDLETVETCGECRDERNEK
jgi:hypothetical protein